MLFLLRVEISKKRSGRLFLAVPHHPNVVCENTLQYTKIDPIHLMFKTRYDQAEHLLLRCFSPMSAQLKSMNWPRSKMKSKRYKRLKRSYKKAMKCSPARFLYLN